MALKLTKWSKKLRTELIWQDYQHRELLRSMRSLYKAIMDRKNSEEVPRVIGFWDGYFKDHFGIEQKFMKIYDCPENAQHI